jgi:hypothetical protein
VAQRLKTLGDGHRLHPQRARDWDASEVPVNKHRESSSAAGRGKVTMPDRYKQDGARSTAEGHSQALTSGLPLGGSDGMSESPSTL